MNITAQTTANKLAALSLALSCIGLLVYAGVSARAPFTIFAGATLGAWLVGAVALALAALSNARGARKPLARVSIAVALGYLLSLSIVLLNLVVAWVRR